MFTQKRRKIMVGLVFVVLILALAGSAGLGWAASEDNQEAVTVNTSTAFTYQGRLTDNGSPANGTYDFSFLLYDALTGGTQVGASIVVPDVAVNEGLFTVLLDFQDLFDGQALWLEIAVRPGDNTGAYTVLNPRQPLTAAPYALSLRPGATIAGDVSAEEGVLNLSSNGGYGLQVESASSAGVFVQSAGGSGVSIVSSGNDGLHTGTAANDGVYVGSAGRDGVRVGWADSAGITVQSAGGNGVYVESTIASAVRVASTGNNGLLVDSANSRGVYIGSAGLDGVYVNTAGSDGFVICSTGSATCTGTDSNNYNGLDVGQAEDYGVRVADAGRAGFRIDDPGTNGFYVTDAGDSGIWVAAATNYAGFFNGDINVTGNCTGCLLATFAVNTSDRPLRPGDIVAVIGVEQSQAANADMVVQVHLAATGEPLIGVVAGRADWHTSAEDGATVLVPRKGETAVPGDYLTIITHGPVQVQAGNIEGITPGMKVTLDEYGRVRPLQTVVVEGIAVAESAPVLGLALSVPDTAGLVWILVNPQ